MLQQLDQYALTLLLALSSFLGLESRMPMQDSELWEVAKPWTEQSGGTFEAVLYSDKINTLCAGEYKHQFLQVSSAPLNSIELYGIDSFRDEHIIYSNNQMGEWILDATIGYHYIPCRSVSSFSGIKIVHRSYSQYNAYMSRYPKIKKYRFIDMVANNSMTILTLGICLCMILILPFFGKIVDDKQLLTRYFFQSVVCYLLLSCYVSGNLLSLHVAEVCSLVFCCLSLMVFLFAANMLRVKTIYVLFISVFIIILAPLPLLIGKSFWSLALIINTIPYVVAMLFLVISRWQQSNRVVKLLWLVLLLLVLKEVYTLIYSRDSIVLVPFVAILMCVLSFLDILNDGYLKVAISQILKKRLAREQAFTTQLTGSQERYLSLLHDLKSPITSLSFLLSAKELNQKALSITVQRLKSLLKEIKEDNLSAEPDWYGVNLFEDQLELLKIEKEASLKNFKILIQKGQDLSNYEVFLNLQDMYGIISELIDNSVKNDSSNPEQKIAIEVNVEEQSVCINYIDEMVMKKTKVNKNSTKKGLKIIHDKMKKCGGEYLRVGSVSKIRLRARDKNAT